MLGNLFPNLFGGEIGNTSLTVGNKPELLNGTEKTDLINTTNLSTNPTATTVNNAAKIAGVLYAPFPIFSSTKLNIDKDVTTSQNLFILYF